MTHPRAPGAAQEQARRIIDHLLGSNRPGRILLVIATLVSLGWFTDSLFEWLADLDRWTQGEAINNWWPLHRVIGVASFISIVAALWISAKGARKRYRPRVACEPDPPKAKALILYLSTLRDPAQRKQTDAITGIDDFRTRLGGTAWRMPIEAIAHHLPRLQRVIIISSSGKHGSHCQYQQFKQLCGRLFSDGPRIDDLAELDSSWTAGIDFNDVERLTAATDDAHRLLEQSGLRQHDILIDVTGGQKTNSIAGAAVALAEGRAIQYVSHQRDTDSYKVVVYDVTWDQ